MPTFLSFFFDGRVLRFIGVFLQGLGFIFLFFFLLNMMINRLVRPTNEMMTKLSLLSDHSLSSSLLYILSLFISVFAFSILSFSSSFFQESLSQPALFVCDQVTHLHED
jgi:hypothetical protein